MELLKRGSAPASHWALLPGAWNPPTRAHLELARAALACSDAVVFVLPRRFPHKELQGAPFNLRLQWLVTLAAQEDRWWVGLAEGGLFVEMTREARAVGAEQVSVVCGADAAQRMIDWDYGAGDSVERQLEEFQLLVAPRPEGCRPPPGLRARIHPLAMDPAWCAVSSSGVRLRLRTGQPWEHLVPAEIADSVRTAFLRG